MENPREGRPGSRRVPYLILYGHCSEVLGDPRVFLGALFSKSGFVALALDLAGGYRSPEQEDAEDKQPEVDPNRRVPPTMEIGAKQRPSCESALFQVYM